MATLDPYTTGVLQKLNLDARNKPFFTPALMAYLRGVGMSLSQAEDTRAHSRGENERDYQRRTRDASDQYSNGRRNLTADLQSRGILMSGEANRRYNDQDVARAKQTSDITQQRADRRGAIDRAYSQVEDQLRQGTTERMLQVEQEEANRKAEAAAQKRQQDELRKFYEGMAK